MKFNQFTRALPALALGCTLIAGPALAQSTSTMAPVSAAPMSPAAPATTSMSKPATTTHKASLPSADKFKTAAAASTHCPGDTVVWSTSSKVYHLASSKYYGKTKSGAFVCEKDATAAGYHVAKN